MKTRSLRQNAGQKKLQTSSNHFYEAAMETFAKRSKGTLGSYMYGEPHFIGDKVNSGLLYKKWVSSDKNYYLYKEEEKLIRKFASHFNFYIGNSDIIYDLGPGPRRCIEKKTLPWLETNGFFKAYYPIDIAQQFVDDASSLVKEKFPQLHVQGIQCDFQKQHLPKQSKKNILILYFGSTISNAPSKIGESFLENKALDQYLKILTKTVGTKSKAYFVFAHDCNQNKESLIKSYSDKRVSKILLNILERIKRDLNSDIDPQGFIYEPRWKAAPYNVIEHTFISKFKQSFYIQNPENGEKTYFNFSEGEEFVPVNSFKPTEGQMQQKVMAAGWEHVSSQVSDSGRMCMHLCEYSSKGNKAA